MSSRVDLSVEGSGYDASELNPSESASARLGGLSVGDGKNTVRELQKQLLAGQTALRKAKTLIEVLRGEKKTLKNQVVELQAKVTQCEGAIEATKMDALNIGSHLSHVQSTINAANNDRDVALLQIKESAKKLSSNHELLVREKDSNAAMRHELREQKRLLDDALIARASAEQAYADLQARTAPDAEQAKQLSIRCRELSGNVAASDSELRQARAELAAMRQELLVKGETAAVLAAQLEAIQKKGTIVPKNDMQRYVMLEADLAKVKDRYADLEKSLDAHNELLAKEGAEKTKLKIEVTQLLKEKAEKIAQIDRLDEDLKAERKKYQDLAAERALKPKKKKTDPRLFATGGSRPKTATAHGDDPNVSVLKMKDKLGAMASERQDYKEVAKNERARRKQVELTMEAISTKLHFLEADLNEFKCRFARLKGEKDVVAQELLAQREQNFVLHRRLGELFDPSFGGSGGGGFERQQRKAFEITAGEVRGTLERAVFEWNVQASIGAPVVNGGGNANDENNNSYLLNSNTAVRGSSGKGGHHNAKQELPTFEAKFFTERDFTTSTSLSAARQESYWDVVVTEATSKSEWMRTMAEEIMQRFQMKQFLVHAQRRRGESEKIWLTLAEKMAYIMTTALAIELESAKMCSSVRLSCADLSVKLKAIQDDFKLAAQRVEVERTSKHKSTLKYVQEVLKNSENGAKEYKAKKEAEAKKRVEEEKRKAERGNTDYDDVIVYKSILEEKSPKKSSGGGDDDAADTEGISIRLADSNLDDETLHGVCSLVLSTDPGCTHDWIASRDEPLPARFTIEHIVLRDNVVSDVCVSSLAEVFATSLCLKLVDLRGNALTRNGIELLKEGVERNKRIDHVEIRNSTKDGAVLVCHLDEFYSSGEPLIIDCRHNDPKKLDTIPVLTPESVDLLLAKISKMAARVPASNNNNNPPSPRLRLPPAGPSASKSGQRRLSSSSQRPGSSYKGTLGLKAMGGFGSDAVDYALKEAPSHMPVMQSTFLTQISGRGDVRLGSLGFPPPADLDGASLQQDGSAAAASDAPPGERELGTLLESKIRMLQRKVGRGAGGGDRRPKSAAAAQATQAQAYENRWAGSKGAGSYAFGAFTGRNVASSNNMAGHGEIRRPPKSAISRPKSAVLRRLPMTTF